MSERLTQEWTKTAEEAFGVTGARGSIGESFVAKTLTSWGWEVELHEEDYNKQVSGIDITFRNPSWQRSYTADIKANLDEYGSFFVDTSSDGWLFKSGKTSDRIWHCNPETGWMAWYGRFEMQKYILSQNKQNTGLYKITNRDKIDFITRRRGKV
jgi:hypothetical protein